MNTCPNIKDLINKQTVDKWSLHFSGFKCGMLAIADDKDMSTIAVDKQIYCYPGGVTSGEMLEIVMFQ